MIIKVTFDDDSTADFELISVTTDNGVVYKYVDNSAKSASGIRIPSNQSEFIGLYKLGNAFELREFSNLAYLYDVGFSIGDSACTPYVTVVCRMQGDRYVCTGTLQCP